MSILIIESLFKNNHNNLNTKYKLESLTDEIETSLCERLAWEWPEGTNNYDACTLTRQTINHPLCVFKQPLSWRTRRGRNCSGDNVTFFNDPITLSEIKHNGISCSFLLGFLLLFSLFVNSTSTLNKVTLQSRDPSSSKHSLYHHGGTRDPFCVFAYIAAVERCSQHPPWGVNWYSECRETFGWANWSSRAQRKYWRRLRTSYGCNGPAACARTAASLPLWTQWQTLCVDGSTPTVASANPWRCQHRGIILISVKSALQAPGTQRGVTTVGWLIGSSGWVSAQICEDESKKGVFVDSSFVQCIFEKEPPLNDFGRSVKWLKKFVNRQT